MGIRIHRAIGWGMPWHDFEAVTLLNCEADQTNETLYGVFGKLTDEQLTVPREHYLELFYGESPRASVILETRLLSENYTEGGRRQAKLGSARELFEIVNIADGEEEHVLFFPNLNFRKDWYRWDSTLDYQFEAWREDDVSRNNETSPRDFVKYLPYGHYPFANNLMTEDGKPHEWFAFWELRKRPDLVPAVPSEIRWYLTEHKILDDAGVTKLRPILAQWWS